MAASAKTDSAQKNGTNVMLTGICLQVVSLLVFAFFCTEYFLRVRSHRGALNPATADLRATGKFKVFLGALVFSFVTLFVRCVYRIPELSGGWHSTVMQNERDFIVLDGVYVFSFSSLPDSYAFLPSPFFSPLPPFLPTPPGTQKL